MTDLIPDLLAAIDQAEQAAREAMTDLFLIGDPALPAGTTSGQWEVEVRSGDSTVVEASTAEGALGEVVALAAEVGYDDEWTGLDPAKATHIALWDPQRVIALCQAHRRIVERHAPKFDPIRRRPPVCMCCVDDWPCPDLLDVASASGYGLAEEAARG